MSQRTESVGRRSFVFFVIISLLISFGGPVAPAIAANGTALDLGSAGAYVTFGDPAKLDLAQFTIETWFKRTGTGVASTTGTGGITSLVPLLSHGAAQAEDSNVDANWVLGINTTGNVIAADFEAIDDPAPTGQNVPISGSTPITLNVWHHAAASFNGTTWAVYLDGNLEASATPGLHPRSDSIQGVALGAMLMSTGPFTPTAGRFQGVLDEARVWNVGRTQLEIQGTMNNELTSGTGLVARWGLNEGTSTVVGDSMSTPANGTVTGTGFSWVPGFAVPGTPVALADSYTTPQDTALNVSAPGVLANDTDNGPITAVLVTSVTHGSLTLNADGSFGYTPNLGYVGPDNFTYKANDGSLDSDPVTVSIIVGNSGLDLGSAGAYVTFGDPAKLDLAQFTIETWFKRTGTGVASTTGTGGITSLVPLLSHGAAEADSSNVDANWVLGINTTGNVIAADFEGIDDPAPTGANAPISGTTVITDNVWHHAAASFNGTTWAVYLDGVLEASSTPGFHPRSDSIQRVALGAMVMSNNTPTAGRFQGVLDEARVWNVGRTGPQILADKNNELTSGTGLVARWGLNEGTSTVVGDSITSPAAATGTVTGTGSAWVPGFVPPSAANNAPVAVADTYSTPASTALNVSASGVLANDTDADLDPLAAVLNGNVSHGSLTLNSDGSFGYTPTAGYNGPDSFTYHANDGTDDSNVVTVSLLVGDLRGAWTMDGDANDGSGFANNGTLVGGPTFVAGQFGSAIQLDGSTQYATVADAASLDLTTGMTLAAWVKTNTVATQYVIKKATQGATNGYELSLSSAGKIFVRLNQLTGPDTYRINSATTYVAGTWYHIAATYDGTNIRLYVNGALEGSPLAGPAAIVQNNLLLGIGAQGDGVSKLNGLIDDARVYSRALSPSEIAALATPPVTNTAPVAVADSYSIGENSSLNVVAPGVLGNDTDVDLDPLTAVLDVNVTHGSLALNANGGFVYTPNPAYVGPDSFTYHANDSTADSNIVTVSIDVTAAPPSPPTVTLNAPSDGAIGTSTSPSIAADVADPNGGTLTVEFWGRVAASGNFTLLATNLAVPAGSTTSTTWSGLSPGQRYEWFAKVSDGGPQVQSTTWTFNTAAGADPVFVGAGDIADCGRTQDTATGAIIAGIPGHVWTAGDNVYPEGVTLSNYTGCYEAAWGGAIKARTRPVPGNHDWGTAQVPSGSETLASYNSYFGPAATDGNGKSYYSYDIPSSNWHVVNLDTECAEVTGGCGAGSAQDLWLEADLAANTSKNVIAIWHKPRYSSGVTNLTAIQPLWDDLYDAGVDILLDGHDHIYERLAPMKSGAALSDPPVADPTYGIRQFTVGTGGAALQSCPGTGLATSQVCNSSTYGVLKLTLHDTTYDWVFLPIAGSTFTDAGSGSVHGAPPVSNNAPVAVGDAYSTPLNTALNVGAPGVLGNDTDGDLDPITAVMNANVAHGSLTLNANGSFLYTPTPAYNGPDSFTYHATDGTDDSNVVTVSLTVGAPVNTGLDLNGTSYVTFGDPAKLDLAQFTIETWFKRIGTGTSNTTGTGGITVVPLLTHGAPESDGSNVDANWILGINTAGNVIAADFEGLDDPLDPNTGQNAPISGTTAITLNVWHHAAATFNGTTWAVYLDGVLEASSTPGFHPRNDSIQRVALGTMLTSTGTSLGLFDGVIDEARVWDHARLGSEILADKNNELTSGTGLVARWGLNEGTSTVVGDSITSPAAATGTVTGTGSAWVPGFVPPAAGNTAPNAPTLNAPANGATGVALSPTLSVGVSDPNASDPLTVTFFGRPLASGNFAQIAQHSGIVSGTNDTANWANLGAGQTFEWYATVSDGNLTTTGPTWTFHTLASVDPVFVGVGDIGSCAVTTDTDTGNLIAGIDGAIWTTGDNVYDNGLASEFANCYEPTPWGSTPVQSRTRPVPGNHDWGLGNTNSLAGYIGYYGAAATDANGKSYYSYDIAGSNWHVVNLDTECALVLGCNVGSAQEVWLKADLAANASKNVIAIWHKPRYSSGATNLQTLQPLWDAIYAAGVDILLDGHDHIYERTAPMKSGATLSDPPVADPTYGIRQFTVGTGGQAHHGLATTLPTSQVRNDTDFGVMKLTLHATTYDWVFLPIAGSTFTDSGSGSVHAAPPDVNDVPVAVADAYTTPQNTALNVAAPGVLGNDTDGDLDPLTAVLNANVTHGALTLNANGSFLYTPTGGYTGPDSFTYHANDGTADSNVVTVSLNVAPSGLIAYWNMNETSGTVAADTGVAPANNAGTVGGPTWVAGTMGNALRFNGTTQYATTPDGNDLDITSAITIAAWVKPEKVGSSNIPQLLVQKATTGATNGYELGLTGATSTAPQKAYIRFNEATNFDAFRVTSTTLYPTNGTTWIHVAGTWDGTTIRFYYNGVQQGTPVAFAGPIGTNTLSLGLGGPPVFNAPRLFQGAMDDVRLYNRALSPAEILALATPSTNNAPNTPTLNAPGNGATGISTSPTLSVGVFDQNNDPLTVTFFGRPLASGNFAQIAQHSGIVSGTNDTALWPSLGAGQTYEWYATVGDGSFTTTGPTWTFHTLASVDPVFVGVGDIGSCAVTTDTDTGNLIAGIDGAIWTTGDNVYPNGTATDFANCYEPTPWGSTPVQSRTRPIPGNHDWGLGAQENLTDYFAYYGANANAGGTSYYSYDIAGSNWHVVNLDSECALVPGGCGVGSAQELWLKADLAANASKNVIAAWHRPRYSSGQTNLQTLQPLWDDLYAAGADILLDGHDHIYERFVPMKSGATLSDPPVADPLYGIHQFTVGTGGEAHHSFGTTLGTSVVRNNTDFGVMKFTLHANSYDWVFLPIAGSTFTDSGTGTVHGAPAGASFTNIPVSAGSGEKPQSKLWEHDGTWWAVLPSTGVTPNGTWLWKLNPDDTWTNVLLLSNSTSAKADAKVVGDVTHVLLYSASPQLVSLEYVPASHTYQLWSTRPSATSISLPGSEIATIDIDSTGRMWLATENGANLNVYYSDAPYSSFTGPISLATNINDDDIGVVTALPNNTIGVLWSNQTTQRFGFKVHVDGALPGTWSADEVPASGSALNVGLGMADDHLNVAVAADGTLYAAVKTSYDTAGYPKIALLIRRPNGTWDPLYEVDQNGTRGIVLLNEQDDTVRIVYTSAEGYNDLVVKESPTSAINFGPRTTIIPGGVNDATSTKQNWTDRVPVIATSATEARTAFLDENPPTLSDDRGIWLLNEGSGPSVLDSSTFGNDGAIQGNPTWVAGKVGLAMRFDGTGDYALIPDDASLDITGPMSMALWVRPEQVATQHLLQKSTNSGTNGYELSLATSGKPFFRFNQTTSGDTFRVNGTTSYPIDGTTWMHLAATYDGTTMRLYVNGALEGSVVGPASIVANSLALAIGAQPDGLFPLTGALDDVRLYSRALSLSEIQALANPTPVVGLLRVTTNPALPSQISINGVIADSWGLTWLELAPGNYTVHFGHIEGYTEPADQLVTVTAGLTTTLNGNFTQRGSLRVMTSPAVPGQISVDAIPRDNWGMWTDIPTGAHQVCFGPVAGFTAPGCQNITVNAGALTTVTGTYP